MMRRSLFLVLAAVMLVGVTVVAYLMGKKQSTDEISDLNRQVAELQAFEQEAAVVKRVSQQMEDIAYQQKSISDEQRIRAEQQSTLAMENFHRAEEESRKAKEMSLQAENSRLRAEMEKQVAIEAEQEARTQRDVAEKQKHISEVLGFRSISRTLGSASLSFPKQDDEQLASTLAFASYYFVRECDGNVYQTETYSAMAKASHQIKSTVINNQSPINSIATVPGGCVAVSIYGDVVRFPNIAADHSIASDIILQNNKYDFRSVVSGGSDVWALSHDGTLLHLPLAKSYSAPQDHYIQMIELDHDYLLLQARKTIYWFSRTLGRFMRQENLASQLSCISHNNDKVYLFFNDGTQSVIDGSGKIVKVQPLINEVVTKCIFDDEGRCYMGTTSGLIYCSYEGCIIKLAGHTSRITDMVLRDRNLLVSASYDHTVKIWNLPKLQYEQRDNKAYVSYSENADNPIVENEWIVPVSYDYEGWPLALALSDDHNIVWIGTSKGQLTTLSTSITHMASLIQKNVRNLTTHEWQNYIGQISEPIDFKNVHFQ